ncbi:MAG: sugar ABC transporter substrate-binding protein [Pseudomonadota bacterium]
MRGKSVGGAAGLAVALGLAAAASAQEVSGDITYWHHFTSQSEFEGLENIMASFKERYPDVEVSQENIPNAEYMSKITAAVVADSKPNTAMVTANRFPDMHAMGGLVDITARIDDWPLKKDFPEDRWTAVTADGKIYAVPAFAFVNWVYYRTDFFEEAGLDGPPDTFDEFVEACVALTDAENNRYGFGLRAGDGGQSFMIDVLQAFGVPIATDGQMDFPRDKAIDAIQWYSDLYTKHKCVPPSAPNDSYRQIMEAFRTGQTAMVWHHTGSFKEIAGAIPEDKFMTSIRPAGPAARVAQVAYAYNGIMDPENEDASWAWISYWGEADPAIALLEATGYFPASTSVVEDPRIAGDPKYKAAADTLAFGSPPPSFPGADGWARSVMLSEFQKVLVGTATVEEAVDAMIEGLEKTMN